jgi:hypothetical protein
MGVGMDAYGTGFLVMGLERVVGVDGSGSISGSVVCMRACRFFRICSLRSYPCYPSIQGCLDVLFCQTAMLLLLTSCSFPCASHSLQKKKKKTVLRCTQNEEEKRSVPSMQHHANAALFPRGTLSMKHSNNTALDPQLPPHPLDRLPDQLRELGAGPHQMLIGRRSQQIHSLHCPQERRLCGRQALVVLVKKLHHKVHPSEHQNRRLQLRVAAVVRVAEEAVVEQLERHVRRLWRAGRRDCRAHPPEGGSGVEGRRDRGTR